jgi:hypothetical protein
VCLLRFGKINYCNAGAGKFLKRGKTLACRHLKIKFRLMTPTLPTLAHFYSAAFLTGGSVRNELLAVAKASHAFVVGSKSLNQRACDTWCKELAADWRNYQASNQRVRIGDRQPKFFAPSGSR